MEIFEVELFGREGWQVDRWSTESVFHGFLGAQLDVRNSLESLAKVVCESAHDRLRALRFLELEQIHSTDIINFDPSCVEHYSRPRGDAWLVDFSRLGPGPVAFAIRTADCLPVLIRCRNAGRFFGALHCGWRGCLAGLLPKALEHLLRNRVRAEEIELAVGPGARSCCFEIETELAEKFLSTWGSTLRGKQIMELSNNIIHCDLPQLLRAQAVSLGVAEDHIAESKLCTICDPRFFSYRREKAASGRQLSFIGSVLVNNNS